MTLYEYVNSKNGEWVEFGFINSNKVYSYMFDLRFDSDLIKRDNCSESIILFSKKLHIVEEPEDRNAVIVDLYELFENNFNEVKNKNILADICCVSREFFDDIEDEVKMFEVSYPYWDKKDWKAFVSCLK